MASKVTLAELRREAKRVGCTEGPDGPVHEGCIDWIDVPFCLVQVGDGTIEATGGSRMGARRRMLRLLRALPDGAMKEV